MRNTIKHIGAQNRRFCAKLVCAVVFVLVCAGTTFAQQARPAAPAPAAPAPAAPARPAAGGAAAATAKQNAITLDLMPLVKGMLMSNQDADVWYFPISLSYERHIASHMSIGGNLDVYFGKFGEEADGDDIPYMYFGVTAAWRYYPMSEQFEKIFIGALLGFNVQSIDGKTKEEEGGFAGPLIGVNFGYKAFLGKTFFLEPSMAYVYAKNNGMGPTPLGWQGSLRIGIAL